jgi:hypothetical protein
LTGRAIVAAGVLAALLGGCGEKLPVYERWCADGEQVRSHRAMPRENVCDRHGGVVNTLTIIDGDRKRRR